MPLEIIQHDITTMAVDAIVNAANPELRGGGGVDGCIHRAAGPELLAECRTLGGCMTGDAKVTKAYRLPCNYVIHTVGPVWHGGGYGEREKLISCYRRSLALAEELGCETVAFPLVSAGVYGYPKDQAIRVAVETIGEFLLEHDMTVYLVIYDRASYRLSEGLFADLTAYLADNYVQTHTGRLRKGKRIAWPELVAWEEDMVSHGDAQPLGAASTCAPDFEVKGSFSDGLADLMEELDAGFSETLLQLIDRTGKKDSEIYKKANVDRKLFSKIRGNPDYKPSKPTAIAFAIALELDLEETKDFIARAGYALSHSSKFDVIIEYFIKQKKYDIFQINEALFAFDQSLLGA